MVVAFVLNMCHFSLLRVHEATETMTQLPDTTATQQ